MKYQYVEPAVRVHSSFEEAREFFAARRDLFAFEKEEPFSIDALADERRNLVLGEPGVGKTLLLEKIEEHLRRQGAAARLLSLRRPDVIRRIDDFLRTELTDRRTLLLDGLDEVKASDLPAVIEKINEVSRSYPELRLFVSGRWVFVSRYASSFPEFRVSTVLPFSLEQVRKYLCDRGHGEKDVDTLIKRTMSFGHQTLIIQIPRYLSYLDELLHKKGFAEAAELSRNDLFEYLIDSRLEIEDGKQNADQAALKKRILEKLALTMEIYQTNFLSKDELMTFFDALNSDLKLVALSQIGLEGLYDKSLLRVSRKDLGEVEFENTEFQEYLAAKGITRFADPNRATFALAVDSRIGEVYPSWYNTLTFLADMAPDMLEQLVEFSGLRAGRFRALDEHFLNFLGRVDYRDTPTSLRARLFRDILEHHERNLQRLSMSLAWSMRALADTSTDAYLRDHLEAAGPCTGDERSVRLTNTVCAAAQVLNTSTAMDKAFWRKTLLGFVVDKQEDGVLRRNALRGLGALRDEEVMNDLGDIDHSDELFMQDLLLMCRELAPDHPRSLDFFFAATKRRDIHGRYGLYAMKSEGSFRRFLGEMVADESLREAFLEQSSIFRDRDGDFAWRILGSAQEDVRALGKELLVRAIDLNSRFNNHRSSFLQGLWNSLKESNTGLVTDVVTSLAKRDDARLMLWHASPLFSEVLRVEDVQPFAAAMSAVGCSQIAYSTMLAIRHSKRKDARDVYETGRPFLAEEYARQETSQVESDNSERERKLQILRDFRAMLEPEPGHYMQGVFEFYNGNWADLDSVMSVDDRGRLVHLITDTAFEHMDPATSKLTRSSEEESTAYTTSIAVEIFREALMAARHLGLDIESFRRQILNYIPFAYHDELEVIFSLVREIRRGELASVIDIYAFRSSDLWRHNPASFIRAMEQYHVVDAVPVLRELAFEPGWHPYEREQAMVAATSLAPPDSAFLKKIFSCYCGSEVQDERRLAETANGLLITALRDREAVEWRVAEVRRRVEPYTERALGGRGRRLSAAESEWRFEKKFARPLMSLREPEFQGEYLALLDSALDIWAKGTDFHAYAAYLWEIVCSYFDNLKENRSYDPLVAIERKVNAFKERDGANWLAYRVARLRQEYLTYLGKPDNVAKAVAKYNDCLGYADDKIRNEAELFERVKAALHEDIRRWIEDEGAYKMLTKGQLPEEHVQLTLKAPIENALMKRGFQVEVLREPQLLDGKRTDFLIRYGFTGPIVIEVKLTSNPDICGNKIEGSKSYISMQRYMSGYGARHGIFMIVDNDKARNIPAVIEAYQKIKGVTAIPFACHLKATEKKVVRSKPKKRRR